MTIADDLHRLRKLRRWVADNALALPDHKIPEPALKVILAEIDRLELQLEKDDWQPRAEDPGPEND